MKKKKIRVSIHKIVRILGTKEIKSVNGLEMAKKKIWIKIVSIKIIVNKTSSFNG